MKNQILFALVITISNLFGICFDEDCGPHPGMPSYLCPDGVTIAGPGDCVELDSGECSWEIITCSDSVVWGYLRSTEVSFCMDECSQYHIDTEIDPGFGQIRVISLDPLLVLDPFINRFVEVTLGEEFDCFECSAAKIIDIKISDNCQYPVDCFQDPCEVEGDCLINTPVECIPNYCGGCYADYYDINGVLVDCSSEDCDLDLACGAALTCCDGFLYPTTCCDANCDEPIGECEDQGDCGAFFDCDDCTNAGCFWQSTTTGIGQCLNECIVADLDCYGSSPNWIAECPENSSCIDLTGLFFGPCAMVLGIGFSNGSCQYVSGCSAVLDGIDYSDALFDSIEECEEVCETSSLTCDEIYTTYESLHYGENASCEFDIDCMAVWGHCDVGLGGCHYSVNTDNYPETEIDNLVNMWLDEDCMQSVCDCASAPYAQCLNGACTSAYCMGENPAGCNQTGCADGYECIVLPNECVPSTCFCDGFYGDWYCTEDCGGGSCVESVMLGDFNDDGMLNVIDVVMGVDLILSGAEYDPIGDLNNDGQLNIIDIVMLVNWILS